LPIGNDIASDRPVLCGGDDHKDYV